MSNSIAPGSSADVNVKVTALTTNPNVPVTYKTIILKKNLVNGVNTLIQEMMSAQNIKYVIKYDYVLGENITVPENCILEFDGGSISGEHTITGQNTGIEAGLVKIFSTEVALAGTWNVLEAYPEWFGAKGDGVTDDRIPLQRTIDYFDVVRLRVRKYLCNINNNIGLTITTTKVILGSKCSNGGFTGETEFTSISFKNNSSDSTAVKCQADGIKISTLVIEDEDENKLGVGVKHCRPNGQFSSKLTMEDVIVRGFDYGIQTSSYLNLFTRVSCGHCNTGFICDRITETEHANGIITSNSLRLCSFNGNSIGAIIGGVYSTLLNCTFDNNELGLKLTGSTITVIAPSFEYNKSAMLFSGRNNVIYNSFHLIKTSMWASYAEASNYVKVTDICNTIDGFNTIVERDNPNIDTTSDDFKVLTIQRSHQDMKILLVIKGNVVTEYLNLFKTLNNLNRTRDVQAYLNIAGSTTNLNDFVNTNTKCIIEAITSDGLLCTWNGNEWLNANGSSLYSANNHNYTDLNFYLNDSSYKKICKTKANSDFGSKSAVIILSTFCGYTGNATTNQPIAFVTFEGGVYNITFTKPYTKDYYGVLPEFITYTDNGYICLAIKGYKYCDRGSLSILSNRTRTDKDDVLEFPLTDIDITDLNTTVITPIFLYGGSGKTNYRVNEMTFPKQKGFQYFDTDLNKPVWWTGTDWVDATGATV